MLLLEVVILGDAFAILAEYIAALRVREMKMIRELEKKKILKPKYIRISKLEFEKERKRVLEIFLEALDRGKEKK